MEKQTVLDLRKKRLNAHTDKSFEINKEAEVKSGQKSTKAEVRNNLAVKKPPQPKKLNSDVEEVIDEHPNQSDLFKVENVTADVTAQLQGLNEQQDDDDDLAVIAGLVANHVQNKAAAPLNIQLQEPDADGILLHTES